MHSIRVAALVAVVSLVASAAQAQTSGTNCPLNPPNYGPCSGTVGSSSAQLTSVGVKHYQRIVNNSMSATLHCTRDPATTPTVNGPGTFPIRAGAAEEFSLSQTGVIPYGATYCVADTSVPVSVEVY